MEAFAFELVISFLRGALFNSAKLAKFAKYALRVRDYLLAFFPIDTYPVGSSGDKLLETSDVQPVEPTDVVKASKDNGFKFPINLPWVKGM